VPVALGCEKRVEDLLKLFFGNSATVVSDFNLGRRHRQAGLRDFNLYQAIFAVNRLRGVEQQVDHELLKLAFAALDPVSAPVMLQLHFDAIVFVLVTQQFKGFFDDRYQIKCV
jgi:hypothetical protein